MIGKVPCREQRRYHGHGAVISVVRMRRGMSRSATDWNRHWFCPFGLLRVGWLPGSRADDVAVKAYQVLRKLHSPRAHVHELQRIIPSQNRHFTCHCEQYCPSMGLSAGAL
jgi:hypothetical protein